jgi:hypothetical protein
MAALSLAAGTIAFLVPKTPADELTPQRVQLELAIAGLGPRGCDVEIKPGHEGCKFRTVSQHVDSAGKAVIDPFDVTTSSADRECAFAITIREPGQAPRTVRRGLRLALPKTGAVSRLTCYLSSPSKIARAEQERTRR